MRLPSASLLAAVPFALPLLAACVDARAQGYPATPAAYLAQFDRDGDGRVSEDEYVEHMSRGFRRMDTDGDGVLEPSELPGGHGKAVTLKAYQDNLRRQFRKLDRNRDGYLDARELVQPPQR